MCGVPPGAPHQGAPQRSCAIFSSSVTLSHLFWAEIGPRDGAPSVKICRVAHPNSPWACFLQACQSKFKQATLSLFSRKISNNLSHSESMSRRFCRSSGERIVRIGNADAGSMNAHWSIPWLSKNWQHFPNY